MVESSSRPHSALLNVDIDDSLIPSSNEPILSVEENLSTIDIDSDFVEPTQDSVPDDESCPGLAEIQVRAVDFFSAHSNMVDFSSLNSNICPSTIPTDIQIFDYIDPNESMEDDPDPLVENPDPSFD